MPRSSSIVLITLFLTAVAQAQTKPAEVLPWPAANDILARVQPPQFPDKKFPITDFGAVEGGKTDNTAAIAKAIDACATAGGGHVVVPSGTFLTGAVRLKSNVDLHLEKGAILLFTGDGDKYPLVQTRNAGIDLMNYSPLVYAFNETNIALTGQGILDATPTSRWNNKKVEAANFEILQDMVKKGVPIDQRIFGPQHPVRTVCVEPNNCKNVLIQGVTVTGAHFWHLHPLLCTNVLVDGVTTTASGSQTDGCDPESCTDVVIQNCLLGAYDDCIAIKAGRNADSQRQHVPCTNIVVINSRFYGPWAIIAIGSEQTEGIEHVYGYNLQVEDGKMCRDALFLKANTQRGGFIRDINMDTASGNFTNAILYINSDYNQQKGDSPPVFDEVHLRHITCQSAKSVLDLRGQANNPIGLVTLDDCAFTNVAEKNKVDNAKEVHFNNVTANGQPMN